jgi:hypothetical protein
MRRFVLMLALLSLTTLASSAACQDSTRRDSLRQDSLRRDSLLQDTTHHRVHRRVPETSPGEVDSVRRRKPPVDTSKIKPPTRRDSAQARQEMRVDTSSVARDSTTRPTRPDTQAKKPPPPHY